MSYIIQLHTIPYLGPYKYRNFKQSYFFDIGMTRNSPEFPIGLGCQPREDSSRKFTWIPPSKTAVPYCQIQCLKINIKTLRNALISDSKIFVIEYQNTTWFAPIIRRHLYNVYVWWTSHAPSNSNYSAENYVYKILYWRYIINFIFQKT